MTASVVNSSDPLWLMEQKKTQKPRFQTVHLEERIAPSAARFAPGRPALRRAGALLERLGRSPSAWRPPLRGAVTPSRPLSQRREGGWVGEFARPRGVS